MVVVVVGTGAMGDVAGAGFIDEHTRVGKLRNHRGGKTIKASMMMDEQENTTGGKETPQLVARLLRRREHRIHGGDEIVRGTVRKIFDPTHSPLNSAIRVG